MSEAEEPTEAPPDPSDQPPAPTSSKRKDTDAPTVPAKKIAIPSAVPSAALAKQGSIYRYFNSVPHASGEIVDHLTRLVPTPPSKPPAASASPHAVAPQRKKAKAKRKQKGDYRKEALGEDDGDGEDDDGEIINPDEERSEDEEPEEEDLEFIAGIREAMGVDQASADVQEDDVPYELHPGAISTRSIRTILEIEQKIEEDYEKATGHTLQLRYGAEWLKNTFMAYFVRNEFPSNMIILAHCRPFDKSTALYRLMAKDWLEAHKNRPELSENTKEMHAYLKNRKTYYERWLETSEEKVMKQIQEEERAREKTVTSLLVDRNEDLRREMVLAKARHPSVTWAAEDTPWKYIPDGKDRKTLPPDSLVEGDFDPKKRKAIKDKASNSIFSFMQRVSGSMFMLTLEWVRDPREANRVEHWSYVHHCNEAIQLMMDRLAKLMSIRFYIVGLQAHPGVKDRTLKQRAQKPADNKPTAKNKNKNRMTNPIAGGDSDRSDDEDLETVRRMFKDEQWRKEREAAEADKKWKDRNKIDEQLSNLLAKSWTCLVDKEAEPLKKLIEEKKKELKDIDDDMLAKVRLTIDIVRDKIEELEAVEGGMRGPADAQYLAHLRKMIKKLNRALPNVRKGLPHWHIAGAIEMGGKTPPDKHYMARQFEAPPVYRCTPNLELAYCRYCKALPPRDIPKNVLYLCSELSTQDKDEQCVLDAYKCLYCDNIGTITELTEETNRGAEKRNPFTLLKFSVIHGGGLGVADAHPDLNFARNSKNFNDLLLYPIRTWNCPLVDAWLQFTRRNCERITWMKFFPKDRDPIADVLFKNFIYHLTKEINVSRSTDPKTGFALRGFSLSDESDGWQYTRESPESAVSQKKKEKDFFVGRVVNYMRDNGLYILGSSGAIVRRMKGMYKSVEATPWTALNARDKNKPHTALLYYLAGLSEAWLTDITAHGSVFSSTPEVLGALPHCSRNYDLLELQDGWFFKCRSASEWPGDWLPKGDRSGTWTFLYKYIEGSYVMTNGVLEGVKNQQYYDLVDRILSLPEYGLPDDIRITMIPMERVCAHGFTDLTIERFKQPPIEWLRAIGRYYREPFDIVTPVNSVNSEGETIVLPDQVTRSGHLGHVTWFEMMNSLRSLLFRPEADRVRWPAFTGETETSKTSVASKWIKKFYWPDERCVAKGGFATANMSVYMRIIDFEDFKPEVMTRTDFIRLTDVGYMDVEAKKMNATAQPNFATKVLDANTFPVWRNDPGSGAIPARWRDYNFTIRVKPDPQVGRLIENEMPQIVHHLCTSARNHIVPAFQHALGLTNKRDPRWDQVTGVARLGGY